MLKNHTSRWLILFGAFALAELFSSLSDQIINYPFIVLCGIIAIGFLATAYVKRGSTKIMGFTIMAALLSIDTFLGLLHGLLINDKISIYVGTILIVLLLLGIILSTIILMTKKDKRTRELLISW